MNPPDQHTAAFRGSYADTGRTRVDATCPTAPIGLLMELTHRCPLQCAYCSNPVALERAAGELDTAAWCDVVDQAASLGVLQLHLSGGEPTLRPDLEQIVKRAAHLGLYTNLITAGVRVGEDRVNALKAAGLDHVQLSIQDLDEASAARISGYRGGVDEKHAFAGWVRACDLPLTLNAPIHRQNADRVTEIIAYAEAIGAERLEIAHIQYYGWGLANRGWLMPTLEQVKQTVAAVEAARARLTGLMQIDFVVPDYYASRPKPCMGGWARSVMNITPHGLVLPCHAAQTIPGLTFETVRDRPLREIWLSGEAFNAYRGTDWMPEPCQSCDRREIDWGGCRCQALAIAGDAAATDPACGLSPLHARMRALADTAVADANPVAPVPTDADHAVTAADSIALVPAERAKQPIYRKPANQLAAEHASVARRPTLPEN